MTDATAGKEEKMAEKKDEKKTASHSPQDRFNQGLSLIFQRIRKSKSLKRAMKEIEQPLLQLLNVRLFTIYQTVQNGREIVSTFRGGDPEDDQSKEIRVPLSATSLAGYVALSQRNLMIADVNDKEALIDIHPRLQFDKRFSEARGWDVHSMIVLPIKDEILLGVLQLIRFREDREFTRADMHNARLVAQMLGKQFRAELQSTQGPYDYLVQAGKISSEVKIWTKCRTG